MSRLNASQPGSSRKAAMVLRMLLVCGAMTGVLVPTTASRQSRAYAQEQTVLIPERECKVKYVYLYSFALLTKWPESAFDRTDDPFVIGVLGEKPFGQILDEIARRKKLSGRRIVIRRFQNMNEYRPCHILYVTNTVSSRQFRDITRSVANQSVLLVGDSPDFVISGGVISFDIKTGNVQFNLNMEAARHRNLVITARLSRLANTIVNGAATASASKSK